MSGLPACLLACAQAVGAFVFGGCVLHGFFFCRLEKLESIFCQNDLKMTFFDFFSHVFRSFFSTPFVFFSDDYTREPRRRCFTTGVGEDANILAHHKTRGIRAKTWKYQNRSSRQTRQILVFVLPTQFHHGDPRETERRSLIVTEGGSPESALTRRDQNQKRTFFTQKVEEKTSIQKKRHERADQPKAIYFTRRNSPKEAEEPPDTKNAAPKYAHKIDPRGRPTSLDGDKRTPQLVRGRPRTRAGSSASFYPVPAPPSPIHTSSRHTSPPLPPVHSCKPFAPLLFMSTHTHPPLATCATPKSPVYEILVICKCYQ